MIVVKTHKTLSNSVSDTEDGFPKATRWTIDNSGNLNLHSDTECLATFPHGKWSAVFRETVKPEDDTLVYDCTGTSFIPGITDLTPSNVHEAIRNCRMPKERREEYTLLLDVSLYNRLDDRNEIDRYRGQVTWHRFNVQVSQEDRQLDHGVLETKIRHENGEIIRLLTREY